MEMAITCVVVFEKCKNCVPISKSIFISLLFYNLLLLRMSLIEVDEEK